jgi:translation initiation factor IF-2
MKQKGTVGEGTARGKTSASEKAAPKGTARGKTSASEKAAAKAAAKPEALIPRAVTVKQLADILDVSPIETIKQLMRNGIMANVNQVVDYDTAAVIAASLGYEPKEEGRASQETSPRDRFVEEESAAQRPRPPVVTILGHVDHGKTKLLDTIRQANVIDTEAGNITQHIGAYQVELHGQRITFLDTPGHEAFTAMRARGAQVTDLAILVVAADDGVMPQTIEAIDHAQAAGVPIVVAINKIDKASANPDRVKQQLADHNVLIEEWGGEVVSVPVSAKQGDGIPELLENLLIAAEILELKADPTRPAVGAIIEAKLDSSKGTLATVLVQTGTLRVGDNVVVGETWGKVKAMFDDKGKRIRKAEPSAPAEVLGLNEIPQAGDILRVVASEKTARAEAEQRRTDRESLGAAAGPRLSNIAAQIQAGQVKELNIVLKTDVQGSLEPIRSSLERLGSDEVKIRIVHHGSGSITDNDVLLAIASKGVVIGFNTRPEPGAKLLADSQNVDIRNYQIIYELVDDLEKALAGMLEPTYADVVEGHAEVRAIFKVRRGKIAGAYVTDGKVSRGAFARVIRDGETIHESSIASLKHFKDDAREMSAGFECGIGVADFAQLDVGDIIESYRREKQ